MLHLGVIGIRRRRAREARRIGILLLARVKVCVPPRVSASVNRTLGAQRCRGGTVINRFLFSFLSGERTTVIRWRRTVGRASRHHQTKRLWRLESSSLQQQRTEANWLACSATRVSSSHHLCCFSRGRGCAAESATLS